MKAELNKSCIITGGNGLVGSNFKGGIKLSSSDCNLLNFEESFKKISQKKPESIIHCAAKVGGLYHNMKKPLEFFNSNMKMNINILKIAHELNIKKFIGFLSTCIFPDGLDKPFSEEDLHKGPPHESNFGYAYAKRMLEVQVRAYSQEFNRSYFCVVPTNVYGFNDNFNIKNGHVIPALIHKIYLSKKNKTDLIINGSGLAKREFIFAKDLTEICTFLMTNYNDFGSLIVSDSDNEVSIKNLVDILVEISNFKGRVIFDKSFSDGQLIKKTDNSKLKSIINYNFTPLEQGLKYTYEWFEKNYEESRK